MGPPFICMICSLAAILIVCEFGHQLTSQFNRFDERLCHSKWYLLPMDLQKMLVIVMTNTQQPAYLHSYGNIELTRNSFKEVCHISILDVNRLNNELIKILSISIRQSTRDSRISWCFAKWMYRVKWHISMYVHKVVTRSHPSAYVGRESD